MRIESPITGIITRRNIEEGETVVIGTMNNAGTVLLTVADMSVIEAEVEVDETDIPNVTLGQKAKVTIDAMPGKTFTGKVTEIGNSPIQAARRHVGVAGDQLQGQGDGRRRDPRRAPGLHLHRRDHDGDAPEASVAVPIQATTVREMIVDKEGNIVRDETKGPQRGAADGSVQAPELKPGQERKELEGVFVVRDNKAHVHAGEDRHRRREVLRGAVGRQGRRPGDRRAVQLGARAGGRRGGEDRSRRRADDGRDDVGGS